MDFKDIPAIVTGGASGLGEGAARALAAAGCKVAILDLNKERGEQVAAEIGGVFIECNVASEESAEAALKEARLTDALAELDGLPEVAQPAMAPWIEMARTRQDALAAAESLAQTLNN